MKTLLHVCVCVYIYTNTYIGFASEPHGNKPLRRLSLGPGKE